MTLAEDILKKIDSLAPVSPVTQRILDGVTDPDWSISQLAEIVQYDSALTANLLKICNSAYYGFAVHVDSVHHAVSLLGMDAIFELVLIRGVGDNLSRAQKGYGLEVGQLWQHSVASALLAKSFAQKHWPQSDAYLIYTASLLKDIGKVLIEEHVGNALPKIRKLVDKKGLSFDEAEARIIGIDHAELGGRVAKRWNFSPRMCFLIRNHHLADESARTDVEAGIVYLTDTISRMANAGIGADCLAYRVYGDIFGALSVSEDDVQELTSEYKLHLNIAERLFQSL